MSEVERSQLCGVLGALLWPATQTCPRLAATVSCLQSCVSTATLATLIAANRLLHKAKLDECFIIIHAHDLREAIAADGCSDASWANRVDESSTGIFVTGLCLRKILDGDEVEVNLLYCAAQRFRRVCRSSACEVQELMLARIARAEIGFGRMIDVCQLLEDIKSVEAFLAVDAKCLFNAMYGASGPLDNSGRRTAIGMISVQRLLRAKDVYLSWIHGEANRADSLTKETTDEPLHSFLCAASTLAPTLRCTHVICQSQTETGFCTVFSTAMA